MATASPLGEIQTVFVAGLPYDATDRELYLLFGTAAGYDKSMVVRKDGGKRPYAFINFTNARDAAAMKDQINGFQWEPNDPIKLKAELSKRNTPDWFTAACAPSGSAEQRKKEILARQPRTLYITGLPQTVGKDLFEALIVANFPNQVPGMRFTPRIEQKPAFAFVGFNEHAQAKAAMERLEGYVWNHEGVSSGIHASFANTELNPAANETASNAPTDPNRVPGYRTMHIAYLPLTCIKETLQKQLDQDFPGQVEAMLFQQKPGKQPFAFVLFRTAEVAGQAINRYHGNVWEGAQLKASQARTELDVTRLGSQA